MHDAVEVSSAGDSAGVIAGPAMRAEAAVMGSGGQEGRRRGKGIACVSSTQLYDLPLPCHEEETCVMCNSDFQATGKI